MKTIAFIIQILCLLLVTLGILIEIEYEANLGFLLITIASVLFAVSTKLNKIIIQRENKQLKNKGECW